MIKAIGTPISLTHALAETAFLLVFAFLSLTLYLFYIFFYKHYKQ